jgi:PAS domain S-box-containing protein
MYLGLHGTGMEPGRDGILFERLGEPAVEVRVEGDRRVVERVNAAFESTFGVEASTAVGEPLDEHVVPADGAGERDDDSGTAGANGEPARETCLETPDGDRWFLLRTVPLDGEGESEGAAYNIYIDITERKRQERRFEQLLSHSRDTIAVLDANGRYKYLSPSFERELGYSPSELVGEDAFEFVHPDDRDRVLETFAERVGDPEATTTVEYRFMHADGTWRWLESRGNNQLFNPDVEGVVVNTRDITTRVETEQELRLLTRVFSRVFRHNIRNRLNVIDGHAELIADSVEDEVTQKSLDKIFETTEQLVEHSRKARLIASVVEHRETDELELGRHVEEIAEQIREQRPEARLETDIEAVEVRAHREFHEAIRELVRNSFHHVPEGRAPQVTLRTETDGSEARLVVEDNAGGLRESEVRVLEAAEETELRHGSGVGLWLVKWLVDRSNGELDIERTDRGSRITITLVRAEAVGDESTGV